MLRRILHYALDSYREHLVVGSIVQLSRFRGAGRPSPRMQKSFILRKAGEPLHPFRPVHPADAMVAVDAMDGEAALSKEHSIDMEFVFEWRLGVVSRVAPDGTLHVEVRSPSPIGNAHMRSASIDRGFWGAARCAGLRGGRRRDAAGRGRRM